MNNYKILYYVVLLVIIMKKFNKINKYTLMMNYKA